jgi:NADH dehydrogenase
LAGERIRAATVLWAAGNEASRLGRASNLNTDPRGRVLVEPDMSLSGRPDVFIAGDQANFPHQTGTPLPGTAPVAMQQGRFIAKAILGELRGQPRGEFRFHDKGQMATIGRNRAIVEFAGRKLTGRLAWLAWLAVHIYYLTSFKNRLLVVITWAWSYLTFRRGARLIVNKEWRLRRYEEPAEQ